MKQTTNQTQVGLHIEAQPEMYYGKATGKTQWNAETKWPEGNRHSEAAKATLSVLGRGYTRAEAVADWTRRAQLDGHKVEGVDLEAPVDVAKEIWLFSTVSDGTFSVHHAATAPDPVAHDINTIEHARLISTAPELLAALNNAIGMLAAIEQMSSGAVRELCRDGLAPARLAASKATKGGAA